MEHKHSKELYKWKMNVLSFRSCSCQCELIIKKSSFTTSYMALGIRFPWCTTKKELLAVDLTLKASPSSRLPPAAAACCCVSGCRSSLGWRSHARAGQVGGTRCDPADQPRCRRGWWHNRPESARPIAPTGKAFCCLSAPEERIHWQNKH